MSLILGTSDTLKVVLAAAPASVQLSATTSWMDRSTNTEGGAAISTSGTTVATLVASPASGFRWVNQVSVFNADSAAATVSILRGTLTLIKVMLQPGSTLLYDGGGAGWYVKDANGAAPASTVNAVQSVNGQLPTGGALPLLSPAYINGLVMQYGGAGSISVTSGQLCMPDGSLLNVPSGLALSGLSLTASTFYHLYAYRNAGAPAMEAVVTAPSAPYAGAARAKTGDTSRRYLGSFITDASGNIFNFRMLGNKVFYLGFLNGSPFTVLTGGTATAETSINLASCIPVTSQIGFLRHTNNAVGAASRMNNTSATFPQYALNFGVNADAFLDFPINANQTISYWLGNAPSSGGVNIQVLGYSYDR